MCNTRLPCTHFEFHNQCGARLNVNVGPVRFNRERRADLLVEVQRLTLPDDAPEDAIITLEEIEALIKRLGRRADE